MRLKSFIAKTVPEAMALVRDQLGPEAVILSTQEDEATGKVRITAALEDDPVDFAARPGGRSDGSPGSTAMDELAQDLHYHHVPTGLTDRLLAAADRMATGDKGAALAGALDAVLAFAPPPAGERPVMLIGPHGAGKTATAAKLCARARLSAQTACLITMDEDKSGGLAQAEAFAKALDADLHRARSAADLKRLLAGRADGRMVVIDTAGCNPMIEAKRAELAGIAGAVGAELTVVLPAGGDVLEAAEAALAFAESGATRFIPTKLDMSRRLGGVMSAAFAGSLTISGAGISPTIGEGLAPVNPMSFARLILAMPDQGAAPIPLASGTRP